MAIDSVLDPAGIAQKLSVQQLQKAIQDGTIPPYVGIPVLQQKVNMEKRMRNAAAAQQPQQPSVAQQVMAEAQGLDGLQSNLPTQYAGGGIVAFADGGELDEDDEDTIDKELARAMSFMEQMRDRTDAMRADRPETVVNLPSFSGATPFSATEIKRGVSVKEGDQPAKTVEAREKRVTEPAGIENLLAMIEQKESGGRRYDKSGALLTSPKGALGEMQVMPGTARDPGFGITPARGDDPEELRRVGREYFTKMLEKYGDPKLAAIAYNMGPGATDKWLMAGADPSRLPNETRQYAQGFAEGGITRLAAGDLIVPPVDDLEKQKDMLRRMRRMEQARAVFSGMPQAPAVPPAAVSTGVGPSAAQAAPSPFAAGIRSLGALGTSALGAVGLGGAAATSGAMSTLRDAPDEVLDYFSGDIGGDTGLAAAILREGRKTEAAKAAAAPAATPATPAGPKVSKPAPYKKSELTPQKIETFVKPDLSGPFIGDEGLPEGVGQPETPPVTPTAEEPSETPFMTRMRERIEKGYAGLEKQAESDKYLALLAAGLGMMGGTSPYAAANIGIGGLKGVEALRQAETSRAAQEKALMNAELLAERYGQYGALTKSQQESLREYRKEKLGLEKSKAQALEEDKAKKLELNAATRAGAMEKAAMDRAETTARSLAAKNTLLSMDEAKTNAFIEQARTAARNKLNMNPVYRKLMKQAAGFDPGEFEVDSEINDLLNKYSKPQK